MNPLTQIKNTQKASKFEIAQGFSDKASWHARYKHSAYIFAGGLPFDLTEGDVLAIFSQYGELVDVNLVKDKDTGKKRGFAFIAYEDQRSTTLAVDNLSGARIAGRTIRVEHVDNYKRKKAEVEGREPSPDTPPGEISPPPPPQSEAPPPQRHLLPASQPGGGGGAEPWMSSSILSIMQEADVSAAAPPSARSGALSPSAKQPRQKTHQKEKKAKKEKGEKKGKREKKDKSGKQDFPSLRAISPAALIRTEHAVQRSRASPVARSRSGAAGYTDGDRRRDDQRGGGSEAGRGGGPSASICSRSRSGSPGRSGRYREGRSEGRREHHNGGDRLHTRR